MYDLCFHLHQTKCSADNRVALLTFHETFLQPLWQVILDKTFTLPCTPRYAATANSKKLEQLWRTGRQLGAVTLALSHSLTT